MTNFLVSDCCGAKDKGRTTIDDEYQPNYCENCKQVCKLIFRSSFLELLQRKLNKLQEGK
jgi:hypothetical protein